jgi:O-antigen/teichoic acid export membrane protein
LKSHGLVALNVTEVAKLYLFKPSSRTNDAAFMILRFKKIIGTDLVKVSFLNGLATFVKMLTGLVSVKVVATVIGPAGIALLGQLNNFSTILLSISNGGINAGVTKYISEHSNSKKDYSRYISTSFKITALLSIATSLTLIFGAGYFSRKILHDVQYKAVFYVFGATIMFYAFNSLLISIMNGFKEYKKYVIANILGSVVSLLFSALLALRYGVYGALIAAVTFQSVVFFLTLIILKNTLWLKWQIFTGKFRKSVAIKLGHYSFMALASAITIPAGQLMVRNFITRYRSISDAGLWEGMNRISLMYLTIVTTSLSVYYLPKLSELKTKSELKNEVTNVYKLIIPFSILTTVSIYLFRKLIIRILFTKDFSGMENLFAFQLIGDSLKLAGWVLGYLLIAKAMSKIYIVMECVNFLIITVLSFFLVKSYGALGATISYAVSYLVYLITLLFVFRKTLLYKKVDVSI